LSRSNTANAPVAATVITFSAYLIGLCIVLAFAHWELGAKPTPGF
jgi:hypothetical protein